MLLLQGFCVAFDPLDGSSIVDTNFAVGTIFGVWPGDKLKDITGSQQVAAGMGVFGPRTVFCFALKVRSSQCMRALPNAKLTRTPQLTGTLFALVVPGSV